MAHMVYVPGQGYVMSGPQENAISTGLKRDLFRPITTAYGVKGTAIPIQEGRKDLAFSQGAWLSYLWDKGRWGRRK